MNEFFAIFDSSPIGMFMIAENNLISLVNQAGMDLLNKKKEQILVKTFCEGFSCINIKDKSDCGNSLNCDMCELRKSVLYSFETGQTLTNFEFKIALIQNEKESELSIRASVIPIMVDGERKVILSTLVITEKNVTKIVRRANILSQKCLKPFATVFYDSTNMFKIAMELQAMKMNYQTLLMNMNSAFGYFKIIMDNEGNPVDCIYIEINKAFEDFINIPGIEVSGKSIEEISPFNKVTMERFKEAFKSVALSGENYKVDELYIENLNKWYSVFAYSPQKGHLAVVLNDITCERHSKECMRIAKEAAEAANKSKSEFLANMSHEIRTPLNGVVGMIDITLSKKGLTVVQEENLNIAKRCAASLLELINDILDFSKIEAGKLAIVKINFNIRNFIEGIIKIHLPLASEKQIELNYMISSSVPEFLIGDSKRLQQVLTNLINNAIKFTEKGSVTIVVKNEENGAIKFDISDTGIGISQIDMDKLFINFSQIDSSFTRKYGGTGLGLVISKQLVELMGGKILAQSEKGIGSTFSFAINFEVGENPVDKDIELHDIPKIRNITNVLLVEDDKINQIVVCRILNESNHQVDVANNGIEALALLDQKVYDVILMDIQMPEMDGIEATRIIREREGVLKHTPIIAMTAYALESDRERFLSKGMDDYITKPLIISQLMDALNKIAYKKVEKDINVSGVRLNEKGEIVFVEGSVFKLDREKDCILQEITICVNQMIGGIENSNLIDIENIAKKIKSLSNQIEADELKSAAFRVELAARRGNLKEAIEYGIQIGFEVEILKKTMF